MGSIPEVVLNSGHKLPLIGMGTVQIPPPPHKQLVSALLTAIEVGYRHFDTALVYQSEEALGEAIAEALRKGLIKSRDELFITSKLWCSDAHHDLVVPALKNSLKRLGLEYLDLYLVHIPLGLKPGIYTFLFKKEDLVPMDMKSVWEAMESCQNLGLTKSIGVSNFSCKKISDLLSTAKIPPAVNQVELNPGWQQKKLRDFCKEKGIHVVAWGPLGANGTFWGSSAVLESPILKEIAESKGKTVAQVSLRWAYEQGVSMVVKSFNKERMAQNLQIFDLELTEEDHNKINLMPQKRGFSGEMYVSPQGPFKTVEEFWDEEALGHVSTPPSQVGG
ncbi:hypothetical protein AAC387_Pa02g2994 [Persea americana]